MTAAASVTTDPGSSSTARAAAEDVHVVQRGDTLSRIAAEAGVSLQALLRANPQISNPDLIHVGDRIQLPATGGATAPGGGGQAGGASSLSADGLSLIKDFEGLRLTAYQDSGGVWTIGYGHTGNVHPGDRITRAEADRLLQADTGWAQEAVRRLVDVPLTQGQFDALTSFTYNLGAGALEKSTLLKKLNAGDYAGAQAQFGRFVHAGGEVLQGLVRRRAAEAELFGGAAPAGGGTAPGGGGAEAPEAGHGGNGASSPRGGTHTVVRGDTLWDIARAGGVSLQALIAANPQIADPDLIHPGETVFLPGGAGGNTGTGAAGGASGSGSAGAVGATGSAGEAGDAAAVARRYVGRNASELKRSGDLPMDAGVPSNVCCANFVSAVLQQAGLLPASKHTNSVDQLDGILRARGWRPVDPSQARPGDVVIIQGGGVSHTVMVESNDHGRLRLIGSNNVNADGTQKVTIGSADWALRHGAVILAPPSR